MQLRDAMRKSASLIVELPPQETPLNLKSSDIDLDDWPGTDLPPESRLPASSHGAVAASQTVAQLVQRADGPDLDQIEITHEPANVMGMSNMGASSANIVADASRKLAALDAFHGFMERKTSETIETSERVIAELESQIEARRAAIANAQTELARVTQGCESEADKLDEVLEFFSLNEGDKEQEAGDKV